ncbi:hypothetical protein ACEPPN_005716 [Leptodophora sp. 'Broadleaf-Isolate-01']
MTGLKSMFNMVNLYRYYRLGRYLYTLSSFMGFFFILFHSPQRLVVLLKVAGLSHTTIFSQTSFKDSCDAIEDAAIASDPSGCNLTITRCTGKMGQHKIRLRGEEENNGGRYIDDKLRHAMNDDTLMRWYCECHGLRRLSLRPCQQGGLLFLTYRRAHPSKARSRDEEPASWQLLGSYQTRTSFVAKMGKSNHTSDAIQTHLPSGSKRREFVPWMGPFEDCGRPINTVVLEDTLKDSIIKKVEAFMDDKEALLAGGHRHQYGMLWVGPPGCGKTSLVEAIAHEFGFALYTFTLGDSTLTDSEMMNMYLRMGPKAIAVFDDIDRVKIGEKGITVNGLLKLLDGFARQGQTLLKILICNDRTKVPPVVRRKGRVDKEYVFSLASRDQVKNMFLRCNVWKAEEIEGLDLDAMAEEFAQGVPENLIPPANIALYIKEATTPKDAVEHVHELTAEIENALDEKKEGSRINGGATNWMQYLKVSKFEIPSVFG